MAKLLSGKVGVTSYAGLSTSRNQIVGGQQTFIGLEEVEPNLGLSPQNDYVLYGDANGTRRWGEPQGSPSGTVNGITIRDEGLNPVGLAGSITIIDIVGDGVVAIQTHINQGGVTVGLATLTIPANNLDGENGSGFTQVSGISTLRVGTGLTIFAPSGTTGIASIGTLITPGVDVYDSSSYLSVTVATQLQAGIGLSVSSPSVNRAKFDVTGNLPRLNISGISTLNQTELLDANVAGIVTATSLIGVTSMGAPNIYGNVTGDLTGNVTGNVTGNLTGDVYAGLVTATRGFTGNINSSGVSTVSQLLVSSVNNIGFETAFGYISNGNSFMGNLNALGISTARYLQNVNINSTGIITATSFVGDVTGDLTGDVTGNTNGTHTGAVNGNVTGDLNGNVTGNVTGNVIGNLTGNFLSGFSTVTNELHIRSNDGTPGRINYYCESGNSHYVQIKSPPHSEYSGNVTGILPKKSGDIIVGDTAGAIDQNIHTSGIITATEFSGSGLNLTDISASSVLVTATNTTNANHYMVFSDSVSGQETMRTDSTLLYNPSTNKLTTNGPIDVSDITCHNILPEFNNQYNLGSSAVRFANIYSADLQLSNVNSNPNSVDGTRGDWTLQEGENDIFMINNITGKKFKINLTEV